MKRKISITLSATLLAKIDGPACAGLFRSALVERVLGLYFRQGSRQEAHARDLERLNAAADRLNSEAIDVLHYQAWKE
ncbi:MAG TPA: hypothetical protein VH161_02655 [Candidatus Acidoferrales bacterium]|jgi:hypothetical protein|nr:hypothetical protein [Candidatus Acidoferrales bacterium]